MLITGVLNISPPVYYWIILGLAVWIIYTTDRILDVTFTAGEATSQRHRFHYRHRFTLGALVVFFSIVAGIFALLMLQKEVIIFGCILGLLSILYLITLWFTRSKPTKCVQKELFIAIIYTAGICGAPMIWHNAPLIFGDWLIVFSILTLTFLNLLIYSIYDYEEDLKDEHKSIVQDMGKRNAGRLVIAIVLVNLIICGICIFIAISIEHKIAFFLLMIMSLGHLLLFRNTRFLKINDRYRYIGEAIFFMGWLMLVV